MSACLAISVSRNALMEDDENSVILNSLRFYLSMDLPWSIAFCSVIRCFS